MRLASRCISLAALALLALPSLAAAQAAPSASAAAPRDTAADRRAALAVVKKLFDAMRTSDTAAARALFHPQAQLSTMLERNGEPMVRLESVDGLVKAIAGPHPEVLDERTSNEIVHLDGPLAVVWTDYAFYVGSRFSHCGVDVFQLAQTKGGWQIVALADTRRRTGCTQ